MRYGGRGIKLYSEWYEDMDKFIEWIDMHLGKRPSKFHSLDRINNNGNYEPGNLRWATWIEQQSNRSDNKMVEYKGTIMTNSACARYIGVSRQNISQMRNRKTNKYGIKFL